MESLYVLSHYGDFVPESVGIIVNVLGGKVKAFLRRQCLGDDNREGDRFVWENGSVGAAAGNVYCSQSFDKFRELVCGKKFRMR